MAQDARLQKLKSIHANLIECLHDNMTTGDVNKMKSLCTEIPPGVLQRKTEARDVLWELTARGAIAHNRYQRLKEIFESMGRRPLCMHIIHTEGELRIIAEGT